MAPALINFTDRSSGGPTAWSWTFGDGGSSTVQNPSHTYSSTGLYTVSLKATNSAGNNTSTVSNFVTIAPYLLPVATFEYAELPSGTGALGAVPFTVSFTNPPYGLYSWLGPAPTVSWNFGDGGTSTVQNPSHTYTTTGTYSVTLTATQSYAPYGSVTFTMPNYITACNEAIVYPDSYYIHWSASDGYGNSHLLSGSLSDLQTENGVGMDIECSTTGGPPSCPANVMPFAVSWFATTSYTPSQLLGVMLECKVKTGVAGHPGGGDLYFEGPNFSKWAFHTCPAICSDGNNGVPYVQVQPFPSTFTWFRQTRIAAEDSTFASMFGTGGSDQLGFRLCCNNAGTSSCGSTTAYDLDVDTLRWHLYLVPTQGPPTANFTGNPTTGAAPLAVAFTDCSSGIPTAWSWNFGESGGTSTAQNPSHTYNSNGAYTVALTVTNSYGQNTMTRTNYINVGNPPVANFSGTPTTGGAPLTVSFTDSSTNSPTAWSWSFGEAAALPPRRTRATPTTAAGASPLR